MGAGRWGESSRSEPLAPGGGAGAAPVRARCAGTAQAAVGESGRTAPVSCEPSAAGDSAAGVRGEGDAKAGRAAAVSRASPRYLPGGAAPVRREGTGAPPGRRDGRRQRGPGEG